MRDIGFPRVLVAALALAGCRTTYQPPSQAEPRPVVTTRASFDHTWNAVIDVFARQNVPIQTIDRSSGFIVAVTSNVPANDAPQWASCGTVSYRDDEGVRQQRTLLVDRAEYNVVVRRTPPRLLIIPTGATVRVNVQWTAHAVGVPGHPDNTITCETTNVLEGQLEEWIRLAAEGRIVPR